MTCLYKSGSVTPYFYSVWTAMQEMNAELRAAGDGVGITQQMIADRIGRKINQSMRKALKQLMLDGCIRSFRFYTLKGGLSVAYEVLAPNQQLPLEMPERPF